MECKQFNILLHDFRNGTLPPGLQPQFREHHSKCAGCAGRLAEEAALALELRQAAESMARPLHWRPSPSTRLDAVRVKPAVQWRLVWLAVPVLFAGTLLFVQQRTGLPAPGNGFGTKFETVPGRSTEIVSLEDSWGLVNSTCFTTREGNRTYTVTVEVEPATAAPDSNPIQ